MNSFIPWVGGKSKLLWIINKMAPDHYSRFIDVFGGSGTVTMSRPIQQGCMEVYNDFNSNLTNLFCCVKNRPLALLAELGFLPLNTRDDFNVLYKFLSKGEITDDYLQEEMELTEILLKPPEAEAIRTLLLERAPRGDVRRAADFFKLVRYSFSGSSKSFGGKPCDIRRFFHLIWECSRRLANVIVENKDFEDVIRQYSALSYLGRFEYLSRRPFFMPKSGGELCAKSLCLITTTARRAKAVPFTAFRGCSLWENGFPACPRTPSCCTA